MNDDDKKIIDKQDYATNFSRFLPTTQYREMQRKRDKDV